MALAKKENRNTIEVNLTRNRRRGTGGVRSLRPEVTVTASVHTTPVRVTVTPALNYFEKCPQCGYPAEAVFTVRTYATGQVVRELVATCGMPCGWQSTT
jgi:hypothetical protein